ncbi:putative transposable element Hobo transposase [Penaeus vannamei]|uniref:Putative transposable element Hobo transposase n=1 Tax=Penaeus vannamei TaxID=6689 RepID=A0A3R7ME64_PENVA|nr:putative transposable element Hobo transposase [Penaeus vannamei]
MTEVVDKTLIERLILEHSDRLELEINQKARADAWKFYYRVRVDHVIRPFAVCKVCFRVLHCDSRSGTASLLRHPCNPLSERSPVNRAVKLSAKLNLPADTAAAALKGEIKSENFISETNVKEDVISLKNEHPLHSDGGSARSSPVSLTTTASRSSPTSTGSPPTAAQPTTTSSGSASAGCRKRKAGTPPPSFPIDLRFLQLPLVAAAAAHPLTALNLANATAFLADPQRIQHLQQQLHHSHLEQLHRQHQQHQQQQQQQQQQREKEREEQEAKRARLEVAVQEASAQEEAVQQLVSSCSSRVTLGEKDAAGSHYISDVWSRFSVVFVDGVIRPFAACKTCHKVVTYTKYSGTGGLLRHRCSATDINSRPHDDALPPLSLRNDIDDSRPLADELAMAPTAAMAGVARALLRYMCQDLVSSSVLDSSAFQRLVWTVLNLGAAHGTFREEEPLPSARQLLNTFLSPMAGNSRSLIARAVLDQTNLCLSLHHERDLNLLTGAIHFITPKFELRSYGLGAHRLSENETEEEALMALMEDFFSDALVPSAMRDKHVTVVSDRGTPSEPGVVGVRCLWHATEAALEALIDESSYRQICDDVASILSFLADSGVASVTGCGLKPHEVRRWDALLHALNFITAHHDELCVVLAGSEGGGALWGASHVSGSCRALVGGASLPPDGARPAETNVKSSCPVSCQAVATVCCIFQLPSTAATQATPRKKSGGCPETNTASPRGQFPRPSLQESEGE